MAKVEIHFFHGFLGSPEDWQETLAHLPKDFAFISHDLLKDTWRDDGGGSAFSSWARQKEAAMGQTKAMRVVVGYSLGGRLAMQLSSKYFDRALLVSAHPGLLSNFEERLAWDQNWFDKMKDLSWQDWLEAWNTQEVFENDRNRPKRHHSKSEVHKWGEILLSFSRAKQQEQDQKLQNHRQKYLWLYGEQDERYHPLVPRMARLLGESQVVCVKNSGHGIPFENPKSLAKYIEKAVSHVP